MRPFKNSSWSKVSWSCPCAVVAFLLSEFLSFWSVTFFVGLDISGEKCSWLRGLKRRKMYLSHVHCFSSGQQWLRRGLSDYVLAEFSSKGRGTLFCSALAFLFSCKQMSHLNVDIFTDLWTSSPKHLPLLNFWNFVNVIALAVITELIFF